MKGQLSCAVLRGLGGSNTSPATRFSGYEVREYVLLKWDHQCAYCDARNVPLELDHVHPRSRYGSNRVSNLTLACTPCNQRKSNQNVREFLKDEPERLARILAQLKASLRDAAAVSATST
jgi:5-methylcytosine-specific restriction endonuclease McrA